MIQVRRKKFFLEEIMTIYKAVGQRENCNNIYIPFFKYTVKPPVKADISRISTHLLKSFPLSTILKNKEERKHTGNRDEGSGSEFLKMMYCICKMLL